MKYDEISLIDVHATLLNMMNETNRDIDELRYKLYQVSLKRRELQKYIDELEIRMESASNCTKSDIRERVSI
ncbi:MULTISPECIES: hypothetical protein [Erysipelotrichaceae]|uniref:hypothetical protein n=1 Tax=Erysipelotrichaceae TaxID=128827 RepID=UPI000E53E406|nr:hypothetical protein [Amedibacterium intestinale]RHO21334.1 hypothetical protein DW220_07350 [Eubacterium sp. AM18-26]RHO25533.1 hypothetical protein DW212_07330 [Eubacterium sp. AM18-10LB-B]